MIITITGKIGSGKSLIIKEIKSYLIEKAIPYNHIDPDKIGHTLLKEKSIKKNITKTFGNEILKNNEIDRKRLAKIVFSDSKSLKQLDKIIHPALIDEINNNIQPNKTNIIDAALYKELKLKKISTKTIVVKTNLENTISRLSNKYSETIIKNIYKLQSIPLQYDYIVDNSSSTKYLQNIIITILDDIYDKTS